MLNYADYAPEDLERDIGLQYEEISVDVRRRVEQSMQRMSDVLGPDAPPIVIPPKGFLRKPLSQEQLRSLNEHLSIAYAEENAGQQEVLHTIPIEECGEKVVSVAPMLQSENVHTTFSSLPFHEACGSWAGRQRIFWLRSSVVRRLAQMCRGLHVIGLQPHIEDCWRPWQVQKGLLIRRIIQNARDYPSWTWEQVRKVSMSFTAPAPGLAGHQSGSAIDLRLRRMEDFEFLDLGNQYTEGGVHSSLNSPHITMEQWRTRMMFAAAAQMSGFRMLRTENWHIHDGDRGMGHDGNVHMLSARFGPIQTFLQNGAVVPYDPQWIDGHFLNAKECEELVERSREVGGQGHFRFSLQELYTALNEREDHRQQLQY